MVKRTHIDRLLARKGITKRQHAMLKLEEVLCLQKDEKAALDVAALAIAKAALPNVQIEGQPAFGLSLSNAGLGVDIPGKD